MTAWFVLFAAFFTCRFVNRYLFFECKSMVYECRFYFLEMKDVPGTEGLRREMLETESKILDHAEKLQRDGRMLWGLGLFSLFGFVFTGLLT